MHEKKQNIQGYIYIASAGFLWAFAAVWIKYVKLVFKLGDASGAGLREKLRSLGVNVEVVAAHLASKNFVVFLSQTRVTFSLMILLVLLLLHGQRTKFREHLFKISKRDLLLAFSLGAIGMAACNYTYYEAAVRSSNTLAIVVQYLAPLWVFFFSVALKTETPRAFHIAAAAACFTGIALLQVDALNPSFIGFALAFLSSIAFAFYTLMGQALVTRVHRRTMTFYAVLGASLIWTIIHPPWVVIAEGYTWPEWVFYFTFAVFSLLLPTGFYLAGLRFLRPTQAVLMSCLEPLFVVVLSMLLLKEPTTWLQLVGGVLVVCGVLVIQIMGHRESAQSKPLHA